MILALREFQRGRGRFAAIVSALGLLVFLVLVLGALADGLFYGSTGAVRSTSANAYAFSEDAEGSLIRSRLQEEDVSSFASAPGVEAAGPVGVLLTGATSPSGDTSVSVFGVDMDAPGAPATLVEGRLPEPGEQGVAAADTALESEGVALGSTITVGDVSVEVVGLVGDASYQLQPSVWVAVPTWRAMRDAVRPELQGQREGINAVALRLAPGADPATVAAGIPGTMALTASQTGLAIPGVEQQSSTLNAIIYTTLAVAALVVALFFALLVLEKRELFAALKALGSSTGRLGVGVIVQAAIASVLGVVLGALLARLFGLIVPATVPTLFRLDTLITIAVFTVVAGVIGALFSLRRIARIDPATAIGGAL